MNGNATNADIDLMMEITEGTLFKVIILNNSALIRPQNDKVPIISLSARKNKVSI